MISDRKIKIALMHGAKINAGDFLIRRRSIELLRHCYPQCEITEVFRNENLELHLDEINAQDILILAGGPGYQNRFYGYSDLSMNGDLNKITVPIMMLGMGWWGRSGNPHELYQMEFTGEMKELLTRASNDTKILGCRDYFSANVLRSNGFGGVVMTGCPAWYDIAKVGQVNYSGKPLTEVRKICISDCSRLENLQQSFRVAEFLCDFFPHAQIVYVCHRGIPEMEPSMESILAGRGIRLVDISGSGEGFGVYDDCDLHVGFRVHAHIYALSQRKLSVLIEEDSRGEGVDEALGLPHISASLFAKDNECYSLIQNGYLCLVLEDYLLNLASNRYAPIEGAYHMMNSYYKRMLDHVASIQKYI